MDGGGECIVCTDQTMFRVAHSNRNSGCKALLCQRCFLSMQDYGLGNCPHCCQPMVATTPQEMPTPPRSTRVTSARRIIVFDQPETSSATTTPSAPQSTPDNGGGRHRRAKRPRIAAGGNSPELEAILQNLDVNALPMGLRTSLPYVNLSAELYARAQQDSALQALSATAVYNTLHTEYWRLESEPHRLPFWLKPRLVCGTAGTYGLWLSQESRMRYSVQLSAYVDQLMAGLWRALSQQPSSDSNNGAVVVVGGFSHAVALSTVLDCD